MNQIKKAVDILKKGGIIAYPTDTVYGLGANIFNQKAVRKVFQLKGRNFNKALSVAVANFQMIENIVYLSKENKEFIKKLLPGPLTLILPKKKIISNLITGRGELIGIRLPESEEAIKIVKEAKFPITATSANLSGKREITNPEELELNVDFIVKGACKYKKPSTVIDLVNRKIIREGAGLKKAKKVLENFN